MTDTPKIVAARLVEEVLNQGEMDTFDEIIADDYVNHNMPVPDVPGTKAGFRHLVQATRHAFPDVQVHIGHVISEDDMAVFHDSVTATSKGDFFGVPPNGAQLRWTEIHFLRVLDGRIVEHWTNFDQLGILRQLGVMPG